MKYGETIHDVIKRVKEQMQARDYEGVTTMASSDVFDLLKALDSFLADRTIIIPPGKDLREIDEIAEGIGEEIKLMGCDDEF